MVSRPFTLSVLFSTI